MPQILHEWSIYPMPILLTSLWIWLKTWAWWKEENQKASEGIWTNFFIASLHYAYLPNGPWREKARFWFRLFSNWRHFRRLSQDC